MTVLVGLLLLSFNHSTKIADAVMRLPNGDLDTKAIEAALAHLSQLAPRFAHFQ
jgi:hypothetical protein